MTSTTEIEMYLNQIMPYNNEREHILGMLKDILIETHRHKKVYVFSGCGSNGKTTFIDLICEIMGSKCILISDELLYSPQSHINEMASLISKKLVIAQTCKNYVSPFTISMIDSDPFAYSNQNTLEIKHFIPDFDVILCTNLQFVLNQSKKIEVIHFENEFVDNPDPNNFKQYEKCNMIPKYNKLSSNLLSLLVS